MGQFQEHVWLLRIPWLPGESPHSQKMFAIFKHLQRMCGAGLDEMACIADLRGYLLSVGSPAWALLQLQYFSWPWRLVRGGVQAVAGNQDAEAVLDAFFEEKACCLDSWLSLWLRAHIKSRAELRFAPFQSWLRELVHNGLTTSMKLEAFFLPKSRPQ